jgi:endonuclease/exonuclease/phosphatase family metal-dependent hydrolase
VTRLPSLALLFVLGCGERPLEPRDPTPGVPHWTIQTFNVEAGDHDDSATVKAVGAADADVVCLQETTPEWQAAIEERYLERYPYQLFQHNFPDPGAAGLAVLSRFPVRDGGWHPSSKGWFPGWHVLVDTPDGTFQILNVHLRSAHTGQGNIASSYLSSGSDHVEELAAFVSHCPEGTPTVVLGDFNEGVGGRAVEYLEDRGFDNALPLFHPGQHTWRKPSVANQFTQTLDHILFDGSFAPLNAWVLDIGHSDHLPVIAHLEAAHPWATSKTETELDRDPPLMPNFPKRSELGLEGAAPARFRELDLGR